ncbi:MAG TPA: DUF4367 domain-containing protein [Candidatus Scybalocola faecavium]|nr:DUF4367 domain-containing protein [Candidatus Scybalocola faecavium]
MSTEKKETGTEISDDPSGMWTEEEEQLLKEALKRYDDEMMDEYLTASDDEKPIPLTSEGRAKMKALLEQWVGPDDADQILNAEQKKYKEDLDRWKEKRQKRMRRHWRLWGSVAAAAIFTVVISVGNVQDSLAFKLPAAGFEAAVKDDYTQLKAENQVEEKFEKSELIISTRYSLGFVLDGYSLSDEVVLEDLILSIYSNGDSVYIFSQQTKNTWLSANTEEQKAEIMQTMYGTAEFYQYGEINSIVWQYQGYIFKIEGEISQEELLLLLESLKIYEEGTEEN